MLEITEVVELDRTIQLAIAPAFLLTGIFGALNVLAGRLGRLIDRERAIRGGAEALPDERAVLSRRARCANRAIACCVLAAILLCTLIVTSFVGVLLGLPATAPVALLLVAAMLALIGALALFLVEVRLASRHLPLPDRG